MSCIKALALREPLVDTVDPDQVATNACQVFTVDILTVTKGDLAFVRPFQIRATRNDYIHGVLAAAACARGVIDPHTLGNHSAGHVL